MDNNSFNPNNAHAGSGPDPVSGSNPSLSSNSGFSPNASFAESNFSAGAANISGPAGTPNPTNAPGASPQNFPSQPVMAPGVPASPAAPSPLGAAPKKSIFSNMSTIQLVILIIVSLLAVTFIGLFIWMLVMWLNVKNDVQGQIDSAVSAAVSKTESSLTAQFEQQQKYPYSTFTGPSDLGSLSFEFPKTWSVYVASNGTNNSNYEAYFNPDFVSPVSATTINALRVTIYNQSIDNITRNYDNLLRQGNITVETRAVGGESANIYTGALSNDIQGIAAVFKIRDKTAVVQTDALVFKEDFTHVLDTLKYNG